MDLLLVADGHYLKTPDGKIYSESVYDYSFYARYLTVFDRVYAVVRVKKINQVNGNEKLCSGNGISFLELPEFRGPIQYLIKHHKLVKEIDKIVKYGDCAIFRLPGATANLVCKRYQKTKKNFAVEVVIDPWENFAPNNIKNITRPFVRVSWTIFLKKMCKKAIGVSYVTESYLQKKYPYNTSKDDTFTTFYSSVELPDDKFGKCKKYTQKSKFVISHVSNSYTGYGKGHIPLMNAVRIVRDKGYDVSIEFVGDGPLKKEFEKYAENLKIRNNIIFCGRVGDSERVRDIIKNSDLFVFPTKAEGLPRVLLEAMSEGLPCISSPTCGIPEILDSKYLCEYEDYDKLAQLIIEFITNYKLMEDESKKNLDIAKKYSKSILSEKRKSFYQELMRKSLEKEGN